MFKTGLEAGKRWPTRLAATEAEGSSGSVIA
jgi:hypothetical protein